MSEYIIVTDKINRFFPVAGGKDFHALKDISINVPVNSLSILRGRSGSGKTTLMNTISCLDDFVNGTIQVDDRIIDKYGSAEQEIVRNEKFVLLYSDFSNLR